MRFTMQNYIAASAAALVIGLVVGQSAPALGQGVVLDDDDDLGSATVDEQSLQKEPEAQLGFGLRLRQVHILESVLELFFGDVPGSTAHLGFGAEFIRKKGNFALSIGVEYEKLAAAEGLWLEKGDSIEMEPRDEPDLVEFDDFSWVALDVNFTWHADLSSMFSIRYGVGLGAGLILGEVLRTDHRCTSSQLTLDSCPQIPEDEGGRVRFVEDDIPPAFPVLNMIIGAQFRPVANLAVNVEGGVRTLLPFVGTSVSYMF